MGIATFPEPSVSGGKILKRLTLTSGTSWTVPSGVTDINVTLYGGGGGGGGAAFNSGSSPQTGGTGGTTTFTGATSATGGNGGVGAPVSDSGTGYNSIHTTASATANTGKGGQGGWALVSGTSTGSGSTKGDDGYDGTVIFSTLTVTPGQSIGYSIGAGGTGGSSHSAAGAGGSGKIEIEYWV